MKQLLSTIRGAFVGWWRNRIAVYYLYEPEHGTLQQQLDRLVVPPRYRWRCRPRLIACDVEQLEPLTIPGHIDLLAEGGTYHGVTFLPPSGSMTAVDSAFHERVGAKYPNAKI